MKKLGLLFSALFFTAASSFAGVVILEGQYQEKNIYVANSLSSVGVGFCTYEVRVNGNITTDELNSSAFEIDLTMHGLNLGQNVFIEIKYKEDCSPKVLNPGALKPHPTFDTQDIKVDDEGVVKWSTTGEQGELPYYIQQYKWNKWVTIGEVNGKGTASQNDYAFKAELVSGKNTFRVYQRGYDKMVKYSPEANIMSKNPKTTWTYDRKEARVNFSNATSYEVYDRFGQMTKKGYGDYIDVSNLGKEDYYISYDSATDSFKKR